MKTLKLLLLFSTFLVVGLVFPKNSFASEGTYEIRPTNQETYRCWASSIYIGSKYEISIGCVDLIYPPKPPELYKYYILWVTPTNGKSAIRLGQLGGGTGNFTTKSSFSQLFVTLEKTNNPKTPSSQIVMRGSTQPIDFLLKPTTPTPTPTIAPENDQGGTDETDSSNTDNVDTSQLSTKDKLVLALRRAGVAAVVALVVIIGLVFVVSRSRG